LSISPSSARVRVPVLVAALLFLGRLAEAGPAESIRGRGLVAGETLILFADVHRCSPEQSLPVAQIFVSPDGGQSWAKRGPEIPGATFELVEPGAGVPRIAGLLTAEGPGVDPFLLVPTADGATWTLATIKEGPAELLGVERTGPASLLARVRPVDPSREGAKSAVLVYGSRDNGASWATARGTAVRPPTKRFGRISMRSGSWRLVERADGGFDVQRRETKGWRVVKEFPWTPCPSARQ
jgi:hypothetical protein